MQGNNAREAKGCGRLLIVFCKDACSLYAEIVLEYLCERIIMHFCVRDKRPREPYAGLQSFPAFMSVNRDWTLWVCDYSTLDM